MTTGENPVCDGCGVTMTAPHMVRLGDALIHLPPHEDLLRLHTSCLERELGQHRAFVERIRHLADAADGQPETTSVPTSALRVALDALDNPFRTPQPCCGYREHDDGTATACGGTMTLTWPEWVCGTCGGRCGALAHLGCERADRALPGVDPPTPAG